MAPGRRLAKKLMVACPRRNATGRPAAVRKAKSRILHRLKGEFAELLD
jgi:hypothetical protein